MCIVGLAEAITLKGNAEREKYLSVFDVIDIIGSDDTEFVIHIMDSLGLFSLTVYELNSLDPYNPIYKPISNSYELKQKVRDYRKASRQFIHEDNNFDEYITLQRCLKKNLWSRFDLLKIEEIAKNTSLIVWGDSNALYSMYSDMINRRDSEYYELPESSQQAIKDYRNLGSYQRELINVVSYSPEQIICLMTNDDPARINRDEKYQVYWDMVSNAVDVNELTPIDEEEKIKAEQVKVWLAKCGFIYKNFNADLTIEQSVQNEELQKRVAEFEKEAANVKATGSLSMGTPPVTQVDPKTLEQLSQELIIANIKIADLDSQLEKAKAELENKPADDLNKVPHQSYRTVARVMYAMAQLANLDNSKPFSQNKPSLNASITTILQNDGVPLESEAVGKWLSRINDMKPQK